MDNDDELGQLVVANRELVVHLITQKNRFGNSERNRALFEELSSLVEEAKRIVLEIELECRAKGISSPQVTGMPAELLFRLPRAQHPVPLDPRYRRLKAMVDWADLIIGDRELQVESKSRRRLFGKNADFTNLAELWVDIREKAIRLQVLKDQFLQNGCDPQIAKEIEHLAQQTALIISATEAKIKAESPDMREPPSIFYREQFGQIKTLLNQAEVISDPFVSELRESGQTLKTEMTQSEALAEARGIFESHIKAVAEEMKGRSGPELVWKPDEESWSILQIADHLVISGDLYLAKMRAAISESPTGSGASNYQATWLGRTIRKAAGPQGNAPVPKQFVPRKNPPPSVLDDLIHQWRELMAMIEQCEGKELGKPTISTPITPLPKMNLLDAFLIHADHGLRHVGQMRERLEAQR